MLEGNICNDLKELDFDVSIEKLRMIVKLMPVLFIYNKNISLLINLHEFVYRRGVFEVIFLEKDYLKVQNEDDQNCIEHNISKEPNNDINIKNKGGKPSIVSKFSQIVDAVAEFVKQRSLNNIVSRHKVGGEMKRLTHLG